MGLAFTLSEDSSEQATPGPSLVDSDTFSATVGALVMGATTYRSILDELKEGDRPRDAFFASVVRLHPPDVAGSGR